MYLEDTNKKRMPTLSQSKPMTANVAKREYNSIKKAIEDRDKYDAKQNEKCWAIAKKKALNLKRSHLRKEALAEKKRKLDELKAKAKKHAEETKKAKQAEAQKRRDAEAQSKAQEKAQADEPPESTEEAVDVVQEEEESSEDEVMPTGKSASRSGQAPTAGTLPKTKKRSRRYLPDDPIESRFGVILDEVKKIWTEMNSIRLDIEREERVSWHLLTGYHAVGGTLTWTIFQFSESREAYENLGRRIQVAGGRDQRDQDEVAEQVLQRASQGGRS